MKLTINSVAPVSFTRTCLEAANRVQFLGESRTKDGTSATSKRRQILYTLVLTALLGATGWNGAKVISIGNQLDDVRDLRQQARANFTLGNHNLHESVRLDEEADALQREVSLRMKKWFTKW